MIKNSIDQFIFVVGNPRGGTTLMQRIISNLEDSFTMPETNLFNIMASNYYSSMRSNKPLNKLKYDNIIKLSTYKRVIKFLTVNSNLNLKNETKIFLEGKISSKELNINLFIKTIFEEYNFSNKKICIEKTPSHIYSIPFIKKNFSNCLILGIIRDPRDSFISFNKMLIKQNKKPRSIYEYSTIWNSSINEIEEHNLAFVKYEDLINNPIYNINLLLDKKNLQIKTLNIIPNNLFNKKEVWKNNANEPIIKNNFNKYKNELNFKQIKEFNYYCFKNLKKYEYDINENVYPNLLERLYYKIFVIFYKISISIELLKGLLNSYKKKYA